LAYGEQRVTERGKDRVYRQQEFNAGIDGWPSLFFTGQAGWQTLDGLI
jgi:hypothetical protein